MTAAELIAQAAKRLSDAGVPEPELDAKILFLEAFHMDQVHFLMNRMRPMIEEQRAQQETYEVMIDRRSARVPLQQILGSQEFMGLTFHVTPDVLIPRQDTETLVERVLQEQKDPDIRLLDLCTGSGCIAISLAVKGGYRSVTATDLSEEALKVAERNAKMHGFAMVSYTETQAAPEQAGHPFIFRQGDLFTAMPQSEAGTFDIITSNPPYIPTAVIATLEPEVREHEPMMALDGTGDGLKFYRRIAKEAGAWLKPGGAVYLEIGYDQGKAVSELLSEAGFAKIRVVKDLPGKDRVVCGI